MPYTPPSQQSPASSKHNSPALSRSSSYSEDGPRSPATGRPSLPRSHSSTSYIHKHRRSPSIKSENGPPTPTEAPGQDTEANDFAVTGSLEDSSLLANHHQIPQDAMPSPPDSSESSDGDESSNTKRGRELASSWDELQKAVEGISQKRSSSPEGDEKPGVAHTGTASEPVSQTSSPTALTAEARKISHSRSSTEIYIPPRTSFTSTGQGSDDSDEENGSPSRPGLVRKKSGELVKPALRPSSRRRYSSMPGTPTYNKTVHFNDSDNQTRHFLQVDKPIAVSAGTSPQEVYEDDSEFPFEVESKPEREIKLSNFPADTIDRRMKPVRVERIFLSSDKNSLIGVCVVQNIAFHKVVVARFTLDYWKTTSEVVADYNNDPKNQPTDGCDRFNFHIKLSDQANIEDKTLLLCVRYHVGGQEFWDNNDNINYQIDFTKVSKKPSRPAVSSGLGARPLNAIPRSRHSPTVTSPGRPDSLDDDFATGMHRNSTFSLGSPDNLLGESPTSIKLKPRGKRGSLFPTADPAPSNGLGGRYDFGASLSAALCQAQDKISRQNALANSKDASSNGSYFGPIERKEGPTKAEERPDAITTDRPAMGSEQYKDLVQKFCYVGSANKPNPAATKFTPGTGKQQAAEPPHPERAVKLQPPSKAAVNNTDGANEKDETLSSSDSDSGSDSDAPLTLHVNGNKPKSPASSPFASRSPSPAPVTGGGLGGRAASPISFGYPYHNSIRDGYLSDSPAPTAIHG